MIDTTRGFAYFSTRTGNQSAVIKVRLSDFTRMDTLTLDPGFGSLSSAVIDTGNGYAYFGTNDHPGIVVRIAIGYPYNLFLPLIQQ